MLVKISLTFSGSCSIKTNKQTKISPISNANQLSIYIFSSYSNVHVLYSLAVQLYALTYKFSIMMEMGLSSFFFSGGGGGGSTFFLGGGVSDLCRFLIFRMKESLMGT